MKKIAFLLFISFSLLQAEYQIFKTGQTKSYDASGNEVTDGSIKDDGYYQVGVSRSYTRDDVNEIVIDNATNLMWQDNNETKTVLKRWITQTNYNAGNYNDTSGDTATTYCENLTLGGYSDWRVPTIKELETIHLINQGIDSTFVNLDYSYSYLSSTDVLTNSQKVWGITFYSTTSSFNVPKSYERRVRCVRGGE